MVAQFRLSFFVAAIAAICLAGEATAQDKPIRVRGEVIAVDGPMMIVNRVTAKS